MVDLQGQYLKIKPEIDSAIQAVIDETSFIKGSAVNKFADNLSQYLDVKHVIPCGNGTDALHLALMALDLKPGDEIITTPFTFIATAEVISLLGLKPVFVDVYPDTFNINPDEIEKVITEKTRAIIPVHLFGQVADMKEIMKIAGKHNLYVVEDNAQALGAEVMCSDGKKYKAGTIGTIGCTSFFPSKNLGAFGDGGALFTQDDMLALKIQQLANHGMKVRYYHDYVGINSRLDSIQAAILNVKLKYLDQYAEARQKAAQFYDTAFKNNSRLKTPFVAPFSSHVYHQYTLVLKGVNRINLMEYLSKKGIASAVYYPVPLHLQNAYKNYGYKMGDFPQTEALSDHVISLPIHTEMTDEIQQEIADKVLEFVNNN
ncbi:MAG: DegT/DnrJ/EryC1/StrS family aminotransferase [Bacteroidales bacterium]|nr:DegT/DnrJ/EryC1/StrS family aminotransferase [Bacteroidales bacterium]